MFTWKNNLTIFSILYSIMKGSSSLMELDFEYLVNLSLLF